MAAQGRPRKLPLYPIPAAPPQAIVDVLTDCELDAASVQVFLSTQGINNMITFNSITDKQIEQNFNNCAKLATQHRNIDFPGTALNRIKAVKMWTDLAIACETSLDPIDCTIDTIDAMVCCILKLERHHRLKDDPPEIPMLTDTKKWQSWWEAFEQHVSQIYGISNIPLSYILHRHHESDDDPDFDEDDDRRYIETAILNGPLYKEDNKKVWKILKEHTMKGPTWSFIKHLNHQSDRRLAIHTL